MLAIKRIASLLSLVLLMAFSCSGQLLSGGQLTGRLGSPASSIPLTGMVGFGITPGNIPSGIRPSFESWLTANLQEIIGGTNGLDISPFRNSNNFWTTYVDSNIYNSDIPTYVFGTATTQGWADPEGVLLHMNIDYAFPGPPGSTNYSGLDQFDAYEQSTGNRPSQPFSATHGIFTLVGSTYTDVTVQSYCPASPPTDSGNCASFVACPTNPAHCTTVSDRLLIGSNIPFDTININVSTPRSGGTVSWQYWNGTSFAPISPSTDTTGNLVTNGTVILVPHSDWIKHIVNGSQSKFWVQVTVSGAGTSPKLSRVYGDNLLTGSLARGWNACAGGAGHINIGTQVEYCGSPAAGSTAKFRQQARQVGYSPNSYNNFYGNPINVQNGLTSNQNTWAYVQQARVASNLVASGQNGVMFDDAGCAPQVPGWTNSQTELGATQYSDAVATLYTAEHVLLTAQYGSNPRWWDGNNTCGGTNLFALKYKGIQTSGNWMLSENLNGVINSAYAATQQSAYLCTNSIWCPGQSTSNNPNNTIGMIQVQGGPQFGILDGNCAGTNISCTTGACTLADYHLWDMGTRGPMDALAQYYLVATDKTIFGYDSAGFVYAGFDDYYYWVRSASTVASPGITASTCASGCSIPLSGALETSTCPDTETEACPIRLGGVDIVGTTGYSGTTLTIQDAAHRNYSWAAILNSYSVGATIDYGVRSHQSQDVPLTSPVFMWGPFFPAGNVPIGAPDSTYGFNKPCTGTSYYIDGGCFWKSGKMISGNAAACADYQSGNPPAGINSCSPLLRRDFSGGPHGSVIVLLRPLIQSNSNCNWTAPTEYDTPSQTITLPGTYYQLNSDGTVSGTPITTTTLRGGEAGIYVSQ